VRSASVGVVLHPLLEVIMTTFRSVWVHVRDRAWKSIGDCASITAIVVAMALSGAPVGT
jgi:hypothetical protein